MRNAELNGGSGDSTPARVFRIPHSAFVVLTLLPILILTLYPAGPTVAAGWTVAFGGPEALSEILQNLLLFIPFGGALVLTGRRPLAAALIGAAVSLSVEFTQ